MSLSFIISLAVIEDRSTPSSGRGQEVHFCFRRGVGGGFGAWGVQGGVFRLVRVKFKTEKESMKLEDTRSQ